MKNSIKKILLCSACALVGFGVPAFAQESVAETESSAGTERVAGTAESVAGAGTTESVARTESVAEAKKAPPAGKTKATVSVGRIVVGKGLAADIRENNSVRSFNRIAEALASNMEVAIHATRRLTIVEVKDIDLCLKAIESGDDPLIDPQYAEAAAAFRAINYVLAINIDDYQDTRYKKSFGSAGEAEVRKIRLGASIKFIEGRTATQKENMTVSVEREIRVSNDNDVQDVEGGSGTEKIIAEMCREFCRKVAFSLADFIVPPKVVAVDNNRDELNINKGVDTDVFVGQVYNIYKRGVEMFDPDTGESLGAYETLMGAAKITNVRPRFSVAKITSREKGAEIVIGSIARPVSEEKK